MKDILKYELSPVPTAMFKDSGDMRTSQRKSDLKNTINELVNDARTEEVPSVVIIDGCAYLWSTQWLTKGTINDFISNYATRILNLLKESDVYLVLDRYFKFSIKDVTRGERGKSSLRAYNINLSMPLPSQSDMLNHIENKKQLNRIPISRNYTKSWVHELLINNR